MDSVKLLAAVPELGSRLTSDELAEARDGALADALGIQLGPWSVPAAPTEGNRSGVLITRGFLIQRTTADLEFLRAMGPIGDDGAANVTVLVGPGDEITPEPGPFQRDTTYEVIAPGRVALLYGRFDACAERWPALNVGRLPLMERQRRFLLNMSAVSTIDRLDERVLLALWTIAIRWGNGDASAIDLGVTLDAERLGELIRMPASAVRHALRRLEIVNVAGAQNGGGFSLPVSLDEAMERLAALPRQPQFSV